ncbi:osmoprotectant transport system substrate-binding protein [Nocardioides luteus]|uniref:Glycine/betaine ABC transporter substrate-binding protein n=1 Tax=Nocardioides luteus TaxID=1844 RepID=A0ABQ5T3M1_9ACTN|nr:glycine betaine ABC transporter substrate-binding protein [Nocardioides luteus]MDR7310195.1 osmoprotectant transport system substrate-binding protein [Nocardioides luteus]GGR69483.1 glycine/betaine ABC transporter substrate-binding protein [Nocardioides luteus]GLJ70337.1 glycine/betaine ABC transporter substrate-binding protein [Nocardioides luteus]
MRTKRLALATISAGVALALSGCSIGLGTAGGFTKSGTLAGPVEGIDLSGGSLSVGSKNFTENILLGKMTVILLKSAGADVQDLTNIPGSAASREAQLDGQVELTWEYTGTAWLTYLNEAEPIPDEKKQYVATRDADLEQNDLVWLPPTPMNDTYTMAISAESAKKYKITKLSEMNKVPAAERTYCVESEFTNRPDGLKGMLETYGLPLDEPGGIPRKNLRTLQTGAIYDATAKGQCTFGEVFTTDGRIKALDLTALEDDRSFFPKYNASLVVRQQTLEEHPEIEKLFAPVTEKLTNEVIASLNAKVDVDGRDASEVAWEWLSEEGLVR